MTRLAIDIGSADRLPRMSRIAGRDSDGPTQCKRLRTREADPRRWEIRLGDWLVPLLVTLIPLISPAAAVGQHETADPQNSVPARVFQVVPQTGHLFENWGGLRTQLENVGIEPTLTLVTDFAANTSGGRSQGETGPSSLGFSLLFDLNKILGLQGSGSFLMTGSERWEQSLTDKHIGNLLETQQIFGYQTYRLIDASYQRNLFEDKLELRVGRFPVLDDFLVSDYSCLFMQLAFCGDPGGIALNSRGVTGYTGTWAAAVKVKPTERSYVLAGAFNGDQEIRANPHHGVDFSLKGPVFAIAEVGYQINGLPSDYSQRLGNYKLGGWYDDSLVPDFQSGAQTRGSGGAYAVFDQVLIPFGGPGDNRGLGIFGVFTYAPNSNVQRVPVFLSGGVALRGIFDSRSADTFGIGVAYAKYSDTLRPIIVNASLPDSTPATQRYETVVEMTYRIYFDKNALFFQPDLQYIINPGGTGRIQNSLVIGFQSGINF